jgi:hypothetical protein
VGEINQKEGEGNWRIRSVIMYTENMCNLQAEAATTGLKINSKETKALEKYSNITTHIHVNKVLLEYLHIWVRL